MIAEIINGILEVYPKSETEEYALDQWAKENINCSQQANAKNIGLNSYVKYKRSLWNRFRLWMHNNRILKMY
jgi:hypothetical protein